MTSQWDFVIAAYAVTTIGTAVVLVHSWLRMRNAERQAAGLRDRGDPPASPVSPE
jgi:hypothetical protein